MIRHSLSISNFNKRVCSAGFLVVMAAVFFLTGTKILNYLYWQEEDWERILFHNFYAQEENIDYVYLGSSHVFCALNPEILDEKSGKNNFNMATSGQSLMGSYYLLQEMEKHHKIEKVYLELYYVCSTGAQGHYRDKDFLQIGWRITDYMRMSPLKLTALFCMNPKEYYLDAAFPYIRYRAHLTDDEWIKDRADYKRSGNYKNYKYVDGLIEYRDKGYYATAKELANLLFLRERNPEEMDLTEDAEKYLRKIIEYCQKRGIQIVLYSAPMYEIQPVSTENYDRYIEDIRKIGAEYDVPYYDFNIVKEEYLPIRQPAFFMDAGHLNTKGADCFSNFFWQTVSAQPEDNAAYFYNSYREKLESSKPDVYGLYCYYAEESELQQWEEPGRTIRMAVASNRDTELEYQIFLTPNGEETYLLQDFSANKKFNLSTEDHGICKVVWRSADGKEEMGSIDVQY